MHNQSENSQRESSALAKAIEYLNQHPPEWKKAGEQNGNHFSRKTLNAFAKAIGYIHEHPLEWTSPHALCCYTGVTQSTLQGVFMYKTGKTIRDYCQLVRLTISSHLLAGETLSTKEIAALCGYGSQSSFNKAFKKLKAVSPGKWATNNENKPAGE